MVSVFKTLHIGQARIQKGHKRQTVLCTWFVLVIVSVSTGFVSQVVTFPRQSQTHSDLKQLKSRYSALNATRRPLAAEYFEIFGEKDFAQPRFRLSESMQSRADVTAIIPTKGSAPFLETTLTSLSLQTYKLSRVLLVDDSETAVQANMRHLSKLCENFMCEVLRNNGHGVCETRNTGIHHVSTAFTLFIDSDDFIAPTFVESAVLLMTTVPRTCAVKGWMKAFGNRSYEWRDWFSEPAHCKEQNCVTLGSLHRTDRLKQVGGFDNTFRNGFEDWDLWLRYVKTGCPIYQIPIFADYVRIRPQHGEWWLQNEMMQRSMALIEQRHASRSTYKWDVDLNIDQEPRIPLTKVELRSLSYLSEYRWVSNAFYKTLIVVELESWSGLNCLEHHLPSTGDVQLTFAILNTQKNHKLNDFEQRYHDVVRLGSVCPKKYLQVCLEHLIHTRDINFIFHTDIVSVSALVHESLNRQYSAQVRPIRC